MPELTAVSLGHQPPTDTAADKQAPPINRHPTIGDAFSIFLDHVRWISALVVVIGHIRQMFFVDYAQVQHHSPGWNIFYIVSRVQHQAVLMFFLMSGAVIAGRFMQWKNWSKFDLLNYTLSRITRLWLVLIPAITLCLIQFAITPARLMPDQCAAHLPVVLGNLAFVQNILVPPMCNNVPLWSLANEFWYYVFAGGTVYAVSTRSGTGRAIAIAVLLAAVVMIQHSSDFDEKAVLPYFPFWLLGALAFHRRVPAPPILPATLIFLVSLGVVRMIPLDYFYPRDWLFGVAAFLLMLAARDAHATSRFAATMRRSAWLARPLAAQSYSLYLVHFPICVAVASVVMAHTGAVRAQPSSFGLLVMVAVLALSYTLAQIFYWLLESRTASVKDAIASRLKGRAR